MQRVDSHEVHEEVGIELDVAGEHAVHTVRVCGEFLLERGVDIVLLEGNIGLGILHDGVLQVVHRVVVEHGEHIQFASGRVLHSAGHIHLVGVLRGDPAREHTDGKVRKAYSVSKTAQHTMGYHLSFGDPRRQQRGTREKHLDHVDHYNRERFEEHLHLPGRIRSPNFEYRHNPEIQLRNMDFCERQHRRYPQESEGAVRCHQCVHQHQLGYPRK